MLVIQTTNGWERRHTKKICLELISGVTWPNKTDAVLVTVQKWAGSLVTHSTSSVFHMLRRNSSRCLVFSLDGVSLCNTNHNLQGSHGWPWSYPPASASHVLWFHACSTMPAGWRLLKCGLLIHVICISKWYVKTLYFLEWDTFFHGEFPDAPIFCLPPLL